MNIRSYEPSDIDKLREIHARFFAHEFTLPDFLHGFLCAFTVENEQGIITVGGVRTIAEAIAVTDKSLSVRTRREALYQLLDAIAYVTRRFDYDQVHAFIQEPVWLKHLGKIGFHPTKGQALVLEV